MEENKKSYNLKSIGIGVLLLAVVVFAVVAYLLALPNFKEKKSVDEKRDERQVILDDLRTKDANKGKVIEETEENYDKINDVFDGFGYDVSKELELANIIQLKEDFPNVVITSAAFNAPYTAYTFGGFTNGQTALISSDGSEISSMTQVSSNGDIVETEEVIDNVCARELQYTLSLTGSYSDVKDIIESFKNTEGQRKIVYSISFAPAGTSETVTASVNMAEIAVAGRKDENGELYELEIPKTGESGIESYNEGTDNIFISDAISNE